MNEVSLKELDCAGESSLLLTTLGIMFIYRNRVTEACAPSTAVKHNFKDRNNWQDRLAGLRKDLLDSASYHLAVIKPSWNWYLYQTDMMLNWIYILFVLQNHSSWLCPGLDVITFLTNVKGKTSQTHKWNYVLFSNATVKIGSMFWFASILLIWNDNGKNLFPSLEICEKPLSWEVP